MSENKPSYRSSISRTRERVSFKGAIYHVTQRAPGKEKIFLEDTDCLRFLRILKESVKKFNLEVYAFALMPNHIHLLLSTCESNLSEAMKNLFERYAFYFNKKYERKGHVFCGRFRGNLCCDDAYLLSCSVYIHLNPYRAGLCKRPEDYEWTSIRLYMQVLKQSFLNTDKLLLGLDKDIKEAQHLYLNLLSQCSCLNFNLGLEKKNLKDSIGQCVRRINEILFSDSQMKELDELIEKLKNNKYVVGLKNQQVRRYLIEQLFANDYSRREIRQMLGISKSTLIRAVRISVK